MSRIESQAVGGFYKTQDPIRPLINRRFAVVSPSDGSTYAIVDPCAGEGEALRDFATAVFGPKGRSATLQIHAIEHRGEPEITVVNLRQLRRQEKSDIENGLSGDPNTPNRTIFVGKGSRRAARRALTSF